MCQNALALSDKPPTSFGDAVSSINGSGGEQASIAKKMLAHGVEATFLLLKRRHEVLEEQVGAGSERDWVRDGGCEAVGVGFDRVEGLVYGGGGDGVEEGDEGFDSGDGFGQLGVGGEEVAVRLDDAGSNSQHLMNKRALGRAEVLTQSWRTMWTVVAKKDPSAGCPLKLPILKSVRNRFRCAIAAATGGIGINVRAVEPEVAMIAMADRVHE